MEKEKITTFIKLKAWQKAHALVLEVYRSARQFPGDEQFGLTSQIKRAVISITSNIAEGFSRQTKPDKVHFYYMALGSCTEVQNQLIAAKDLGFMATQEFQALDGLSVEVHKLLNGLIKAVKAGS